MGCSKALTFRPVAFYILVSSLVAFSSIFIFFSWNIQSSSTSSTFTSSPHIMGSTSNIVPLADSILFKPLQLGAIKLEHRTILAPLTRMRAVKESEGVWAPGELNIEYYSQRASKGGLLLTEATPISRLVSQ
jgi:hypothetical protein